MVKLLSLILAGRLVPFPIESDKSFIPDTLPVPGECEPVADRWRYPTLNEEKAIQKEIARIATSYGAGMATITVLWIWARRESDYRYWVRHRMDGDIRLSAHSYSRNAHMYGYAVTWESRAKELDDIKVEPVWGGYLRERITWYNKHFEDPEPWVRGGIGLYGMSPAGHTWLVDWMGHPEDILCDPENATVAALRKINRAIVKHNAKSWTDVNDVFAIGRICREDTPRCKKIRGRFNARFRKMSERIEKRNTRRYFKLDVPRYFNRPVFLESLGLEPERPISQPLERPYLGPLEIVYDER